jgi:hypothetical protein
LVVPDVEGGTPPAKRKDNYVKKKDRGLPDRREVKGRRHSMGEFAKQGTDKRSIFPSLKNDKQFTNLTNIFEGTIYSEVDKKEEDINESKLHEANREIQILLAGLEKKNAK